MNPDRQQAIEYLRAPANGLWRWAENGSVLVWRDGSTIAFRQEVVQILESLAPNGLPSFGALVFLLAACRGKLPAVSDVIVISNTPLPPSAGQDAVMLLTARAQLKIKVEAGLAQLARVSQLANDLQPGIRAKSVLAEAVFETAKVERYIEARTVLRGLREAINDAELIDAEHGAVIGSYIRQIHIVAEGIKPHTSDSLALRLLTGVDALPKEADADLPAAERARRLIEELSRDREFGAVARAARELMAAVRLPRRLGDRDQLAIGGVADITNRGPLDRLLLSELAHDDLTLSVRVALNEALYLRREPPMREPPGILALLLDSGIRLWGVPRVLATAVALALIARDKQHSEVLSWRAHGKQLQPVDLLSRQGLIQHLTALEPTAHPGESVPEFAEALAPNSQHQSVLITQRDALADPEFRRALVSSPRGPGFIATVERDGRFELHALPLSHRGPICEAHLDLSSIFGEPVAVSPINTDIDPNLPAIFRITPFPFLLPLSGRVDFSIKGLDGFTYAVLNDRRLVRFRDQRSGARVLASDLPGGKTIWMDCDGSNVHAVKVGSSQRPARLLSLVLPNGNLRINDLVSGPELLAAHRYGETLVVIRQHDVRAYALSDGRLLDQARNPHHWLNGRFFRGANQFYFVSWDGAHVRFQPVSLPSTHPFSRISAIFDRSGLTGPWLLSNSGEIASTETGKIVKLPNPPNARLDFSSALISRMGHQLYVPTTRKDKPEHGCLFGIESRISIDFGPISNFIPDYPPPLPSWNIYRIVESVALLPDGIVLRGRKNRWRKLALDANGKLRITEMNPAEPVPTESLHFNLPPRKTRHGCTLQTAQFPNGSKIFLDSRGLLHLKSYDADCPEVSLVLADGEVTGWASDYHVCGPAFFFEGTYDSEPEAVFESILGFLARV